MDHPGNDRAHRPLRVAGRMDLADGTLLVWSVAEGRRGRRWRTVATRDGTITQSALVEVDDRGRPTRLELTTAAGLLTLHPEADERSIHGNVVSVTGVRPLALPWSPDHELDVAGRPIPIGCGLQRMRSSMSVHERRSVPVLAIDESLRVNEALAAVTRVDETRWTVSLAGTGEERTVTVDASGLPLPGERWPLEP